MASWKTLPLNVTSRVTLTKMIVLPRLLYYYSNIPVYVPNRIFRELETLIRALIWNAGRPRVALRKLYAPKKSGGLAVPNQELYYLAQLQWVVGWLAGRSLEDTTSDSPALTHTRALTLFHPLTKTPRPTQLHLVVAYQCYRRCLWLTRTTTPYAPVFPLLGTPKDKGAISAPALEHWEQAGIETIADLYADGALLPFDRLRADSDIPAGQFLLQASIDTVLTHHEGWITCHSLANAGTVNAHCLHPPIVERQMGDGPGQGLDR